jgi:hypothetical protein
MIHPGECMTEHRRRKRRESHARCFRVEGGDGAQMAETLVVDACFVDGDPSRARDWLKRYEETTVGCKVDRRRHYEDCA